MIIIFLAEIFVPYFEIDYAAQKRCLNIRLIGRCGGSLVARQTSGAEVLGANPASISMILMRCRIIVQYCKNLRVGGEPPPMKIILNLFILVF